ncbi:hypothetical protein B566_EDAN001605 [Ephemera danica]|nr:hypothetical protein B566_EDAN001605 [Ephemera danica]
MTARHTVVFEIINIINIIDIIIYTEEFKYQKCFNYFSILWLCYRLQSWRTDPLLTKLELERQAMSQPRSCPMCWHPGTERKHADRGCDICCTSTGCNKRNSVLQAGNANSQWQILELQIRAKALQDSEFPSEDIIQEFFEEELLRTQVIFEWKEPQVQQLLDIGTRLLGWEHGDCLEKALQLVSRWQCQQLASRLCPSVPLQLKQIVKLRVQHGERCVEVEWAPLPGLAMTASTTTLEPLSLFSQAYPQPWAHFEEDKIASKKSKKPRKAKESKVGDIPSSTAAATRQDSLEDMMEQLELDESIAEHELSDIVYSIVSRGTQGANLGSTEYV